MKYSRLMSAFIFILFLFGIIPYLLLDITSMQAQMYHVLQVQVQPSTVDLCKAGGGLVVEAD